MATRRRRFGSIRTIRVAGHEYRQALYDTPEEWLLKDPKLPAKQTKSSRPEFESDLDVWLHEAEVLIRAGRWVPPQYAAVTKSRDTTTFRDYAERWLEERVKPNGEPLRETTKQKHRELLASDIYPYFADSIMAAITYADVLKWWQRERVKIHYKDYDDSVVKYRSYTLFHAIMQTAATMPIDGEGNTLIARNPARLKISKPKPRHDYVIAEPEEIEYVASLMVGHFKLAVYLAGVMGEREGECLGTWKSDLGTKRIRQADGTTAEVRTISVNRAAKNIVRDGHRILVLGPPKTSEGKRTLIIPAFIQPLINEHISRFTDNEDPDAPLFKNPATGEIYSLSALRNAWYKARDEAVKKYPHLAGMRFHDLRHTALTRFNIGGATTGELKALGGHASISSTNIYQQSAETHLAEVVKAVDKAYEKPQIQKSAPPNTDVDLTLLPILTNMPLDNRIKILRSLEEGKRNALLSAMDADIQLETLTAML